MYAIVRIGGRQYPVETGQTLQVEKLPFEVGETIELDEVLYVKDDGEMYIGQPTVEGAKVMAEVVDQYRGKKILVFKYIPGNRYRRRKGHRQYYTRLKINEIAPGTAEAKKVEEAEDNDEE